ncbi:MAG: hypothetical protein OXF84_08435 [Bacteroidetes bacterium]|nr:hypothetical protein [Bacteroidota bacterium]
MNETLLYVILAALYLIFTIIGRVAKKRQQPSKENQEPISIEDTLRDLAGGFGYEQSDTTAPAPPTQWSDPQITYDIPTSTPAPTKLERTPPSASGSSQPQPPVRTSPKQSKTPSSKSTTASKIAAQLSSPESAQTAIILGEILGKPKVTRGLFRYRSRG